VSASAAYRSTPAGSSSTSPHASAEVAPGAPPLGDGLPGGVGRQPLLLVGGAHDERPRVPDLLVPRLELREEIWIGVDGSPELLSSRLRPRRPWVPEAARDLHLVAAGGEEGEDDVFAAAGRVGAARVDDRPVLAAVLDGGGERVREQIAVGDANARLPGRRRAGVCWLVGPLSLEVLEPVSKKRQVGLGPRQQPRALLRRDVLLRANIQAVELPRGGVEVEALLRAAILRHASGVTLEIHLDGVQVEPRASRAGADCRVEHEAALGPLLRRGDRGAGIDGQRHDCRLIPDRRRPVELPGPPPRASAS
jgi:hypothetical protein